MINYESYHDYLVIAYFNNSNSHSQYSTWVNDITKDVMRKLKLSDSYLPLVSKIAHEVLLPVDKLRGIAKCSPPDTFDIFVGRQIAKQRLLKKYYKYRDKVLNLVIEDITNTYKEIQK